MACFDTQVEIIFSSKANHNWVHYFTQRIIDIDDLNVVHRVYYVPYVLVGIDAVEERARSVRVQDNFIRFFHQDLSIRSKKRKHSLLHQNN